MQKFSWHTRISSQLNASRGRLRQVGEGGCPTRSMQHVFLSPASQSPATLQLRKCTACTTHKEAGESEDEFSTDHTEGKGGKRRRREKVRTQRAGDEEENDERRRRGRLRGKLINKCSSNTDTARNRKIRGKARLKSPVCQFHTSRGELRRSPNRSE